MAIAFIITGLIALAILIDSIAKARFNKTSIVSFSNAGEQKEMVAAPAEDIRWWIHLNKSNQLALALFITDIALPVWEKYSSTDTVYYQDAGSLMATVINKDLLEISLQEIRSVAPFFPDHDYQKIDQCYKQFIGPVIALQDGDWAPPYAAKKIFLSCYNILRGLIESNKAGDNENFFAIAIDHSLDCIDITKLYTIEQVNQILLNYQFFV